MTTPRIAPGTVEQTGRLNHLIARALGLALGTGAPNLFTTLGRHRRLFRPWLRFAGALMPGGSLPRRDSELLILAVAHGCDCAYEWRHHELLAATAGLSREEILRVPSGPDDPAWSERQRLLLSAADQLLRDSNIDDALWQQLRGFLDVPQAIELVMLVGHYQMLALALNTLGVQPDRAPAAGPPLATRVIQRALSLLSS